VTSSGESFCKHFACRLPAEEEWEFAAHGEEGRRYPWGSAEPDESRANFDDPIAGHPSAVGIFPDGNTPEGVADLAGNVWEWTESDHDEYRSTKVRRGGSYDDFAWTLRAAFRLSFDPEYSYSNLGFRCVRD
jgi:formylglycine-generating enzyme required for sulfatase activity